MSRENARVGARTAREHASTTGGGTATVTSGHRRELQASRLGVRLGRPFPRSLTKGRRCRSRRRRTRAILAPTLANPSQVARASRGACSRRARASRTCENARERARTRENARDRARTRQARERARSSARTREFARVRAAARARTRLARASRRACSRRASAQSRENARTRTLRPQLAPSRGTREKPAGGTVAVRPFVRYSCRGA